MANELRLTSAGIEVASVYQTSLLVTSAGVETVTVYTTPLRITAAGAEVAMLWSPVVARRRPVLFSNNL